MIVASHVEHLYVYNIGGKSYNQTRRSAESNHYLKIDLRWISVLISYRDFFKMRCLKIYSLNPKVNRF